MYISNIYYPILCHHRLSGLGLKLLLLLFLYSIFYIAVCAHSVPSSHCFQWVLSIQYISTVCARFSFEWLIRKYMYLFVCSTCSFSHFALALASLCNVIINLYTQDLSKSLNAISFKHVLRQNRIRPSHNARHTLDFPPTDFIFESIVSNICSL